MSIDSIRSPAASRVAVAPSSTTASPTRDISSEPSAFARMLHGLGREVAHGESTIRAALQASFSGRDLAPSELLSLQAGVYRYGEVVDLASRLVDRASGGVKTILQGQQ